VGNLQPPRLVEEPEPEIVPEVATCKRGHPKIPENQRRHRDGWRCRACERHTAAERKARSGVTGKKKMYTSTRQMTKCPPSEVARSMAIKEARMLLGLPWKEYKALYGSKASTALAIIAAAGDPVALEALKKEGR
jgi:hypothetical protein